MRVVITKLSALVYFRLRILWDWMISKTQLYLFYFHSYFQQFLFMCFFFIETFWYTNACIPLFFPQSQVIGINKLVDFFFDSFNIERNILFGEKLLLFIIVHFVVFDGSYLRRLYFLFVKQFCEVFILSSPMIYLFFESFFVGLFSKHSGFITEIKLQKIIVFRNIILNFNNKMNDLNPHLRNIHIQTLIEENQGLRRRVSKLNQIEGYVEVLVEKIEQSQVREGMLNQQNALLSQRMRQFDFRITEKQKAFGQEMRYVFSQHDQLLEDKNQTVNHLKIMLEKQQEKSMSFQKQFQIVKQKQQRLIVDYEQSLMKYRNQMNQAQKDIKIVCQTLDQEKIKHSHETESLLQENRQKEREIQSLLKGLDDQRFTNNRKTELFSQEIEKRNYELQETKDLLAKMHQHNEILKIDLKKQKQQNVTKSSLHSRAEKELEQVNKLYLRSKNDCEGYVSDNERCVILLEESQKQNHSLRDKVKDLEDYMNDELDHAKRDIRRLIQDNSSLKDKLSQRQGIISCKTSEVKELLNLTTTLEQTLSQSQSHLQTASSELENYHNYYTSEKNKSNQLELKIKSVLQQMNCLKQENKNIETINQRIKSQNSTLSTENHNMSRLISNPRELNKDYIEKIDRLVEDFQRERQQMNKRSWLEKEKLKQMFEYQNKQKQLEYRRKISMVQDQLERVKRLEILTQRTFVKPYKM